MRVGAVVGTDETAADDALFVLTAVLLTPAQFPSVLGDDYVAACGALGLEPYAEGYGLVLGQDSGGARWTVVVEDVSLVAVAIASWDCGMEYDVSPDDRSVVCALPGWPLALAVAAPGVPEPHDPPPGPDGDDPAPLTPPDTDVWGPPQRRLGADEIALQWSAWRTRPDRLGTPGYGWRSRRPVPTSTPRPRPAASAPRSLRAGHARCGSTDRAGPWWPGPTTSPSCCWTRSRERSFRWAAARSCRNC